MHHTRTTTTQAQSSVSRTKPRAPCTLVASCPALCLCWTPVFTRVLFGLIRDCEQLEQDWDVNGSMNRCALHETFVHYWHKTTDGAVHALYWCTDCTELISELILTISKLCQQPTSSVTSSLHSATLPCTARPSIRRSLSSLCTNSKRMNLRNTLQCVPN